MIKFCWWRHRLFFKTSICIFFNKIWKLHTQKFLSRWNQVSLQKVILEYWHVGLKKLEWRFWCKSTLMDKVVYFNFLSELICWNVRNSFHWSHFRKSSSRCGELRRGNIWCKFSSSATALSYITWNSMIIKLARNEIGGM